MRFFNFFNKSLKKELENLDPKSIDRFSFKGLKTLVKIVKVYDGDTYTLLFKWNKEYIKISCRLYGIDTPELRTENSEEKNLAYAVKFFLENIILNEILYCEFLKNDKYGRPLVKLFTRHNNQDLAKLLIENGYGKIYNGGKKEPFFKI